VSRRSRARKAMRNVTRDEEGRPLLFRFNHAGRSGFMAYGLSAREQFHRVQERKWGGIPEGAKAIVDRFGVIVGIGRR
jgi:hypothetical protein